MLTDLVAHFPNGCAVSADGRWLWIVESYVPTLSRIDLHSGAVEELARLDGTVPDGIAFTTDGGALVSCYRPDRILHVSTRRAASRRLPRTRRERHLAAPTNVAFAGDRLISANLGRWHLSLIHTELRGVPLHHPERWAADA